MVVLGYTDVANTAMFASCRLEKMASPANLTRLVESMVVGVTLQLSPVILCSDDRRGGGHSLISEVVRKATQYNGKCQLEVRDA